MFKQKKAVLFFIPILLALCSLSIIALADYTIEDPVEAVIFANSAYVLDGDEVYDNRDEGTCPWIFESQANPGASAIYAKNGARAGFKHPRITGNGYLTSEDLAAELASKYGYAAAVLVYGTGTEVFLKQPVITTSEAGNANGGFATCGGKLVIKGGSITTNNRLGHGLDSTYGGYIYADGTRIHTSGQNSGALATDFGGGYITVKNIKATADVAGSPGIYCAGNSVITAYNSTFISNGCEGVMAAHDGGHTNLYSCSVTGTVGLNGHNSMNEYYSYIYMKKGKLNSTSGALITEAGGKTEMTLNCVKVGTVANGNLIEPQSGRLIVNLNNMNATGNIVRTAKSYLEVSLDNTKLTGSVSATGFFIDAGSKWIVTGESSIVNLTIEKAKRVYAKEEVTVYYNTLNIGGEEITGDYTIKNVHFVYSDTLVDDYEESGPPGPPPGV